MALARVSRSIGEDITVLRKTLPDGRIAEVTPLTYGRARIVIWTPPSYGFLDDGW